MRLVGYSLEGWCHRAYEDSLQVALDSVGKYLRHGGFQRTLDPIKLLLKDLLDGLSHAMNPRSDAVLQFASKEWSIYE